MKKLKKIPQFKDGSEEFDFWQNHDSVDYVDWSNAKIALFPNLKPTTKTVRFTLPESLLNNAKILANKRALTFGSFLNIVLSEKVREEQIYGVIARFGSRQYQPTGEIKKEKVQT